MLGELIRTARKRACLKQAELADALHLTTSGVCRIETSQQPPTPDQVARLAAHLEAPELLEAYCKACPVCTAMLPVTYPTLDNVPTGPTAVAAKAAEEAAEAAEACRALCRVFGRLDWANDPDRRATAVALLEQVHDARVAFDMLYRTLFLSGALPLSVLDEVQRRQHRKCVERGYCRPNGTEG